MSARLTLDAENAPVEYCSLFGGNGKPPASTGHRATDRNRSYAWEAHRDLPRPRSSKIPTATSSRSSTA